MFTQLVVIGYIYLLLLSVKCVQRLLFYIGVLVKSCLRHYGYMRYIQ